MVATIVVLFGGKMLGIISFPKLTRETPSKVINIRIGEDIDDDVADFPSASDIRR